MAQRRGLRSIRPIDRELLDAEAAAEVGRFQASGDALADLLYVQARLSDAEEAEKEHRRERDVAIVSVSRFWTVEHGAKFQDAVGVTNAGLQDIRKRHGAEDVPDWSDAPQRARRAAVASIRAGREVNYWRPLRNDLVRRVSVERGLPNLRIAQRTGLSPGHVSRIVNNQVGEPVRAIGADVASATG